MDKRGASGRSRRRSTHLAEPPLVEWNFDQCPGEELSICCTYELTRSSTLIRETTERRRDGEQDRLTRAVILVFPINATWVPGFPLWSREPYLAIPAAERKKLLGSFGFRSTGKDKKSLASLVDPFTHLQEMATRRSSFVCSRPA